MNRALGFKHLIWVTILTLTVLCSGVSSAFATSAIEGVWSFKGGAVDIVGEPNGTLTGVVSAPTQFSTCIHPLGEHMWTEMRLQPDGSYWGFHQWYFEPTAQAPGCVINPERGPTAWRVLLNSKGESFVRVCFSNPGTSQPTIAPNGSSSDVTWGCVDSASIAPLPTVSGKGASASGSGDVGFKKAVGLPTAKTCVKHKMLKIKLHEPKYDALKEVVVTINGKKYVDVRGLERLKKPIVLKHLPSGTYTLKVLAVTILNQHLHGNRTYKSCRKTSEAITLGNSKTHKSGRHKK